MSKQVRLTDMLIRLAKASSRTGCLAFVCLICAISVMTVPTQSLAQSTEVVSDRTNEISPGKLDVLMSTEEGFGRLVLRFTGRNLLPEYSMKQENSIFVVRFDEGMKSDSVSSMPRILGDYVTIARQDPDGKGVRIALKEGIRINTMEAGERLYVDFLPKTWAGPPPVLPAEVVTELARRAEEALRLARSLEQAESATRVKPKLDIRIGDHPTFSRFAFIWNIPFDSTFERKGDVVDLYFNHKTDADLSDLRANLPALVHDMRMSYSDGRTQFRLIIDKNSDVRAFREDNGYVVDVTGDKQLFEAKGVEDTITRAISKPGDDSVLIARGVNPTTNDEDGSEVTGVGDRIGGTPDSAQDLILGPNPSGRNAEGTLFTNAQLTEPLSPNGEPVSTVPILPIETQPLPQAKPNVSAPNLDPTNAQAIITEEPAVVQELPDPSIGDNAAQVVAQVNPEVSQQTPIIRNEPITIEQTDVSVPAQVGDMMAPASNETIQQPPNITQQTREVVPQRVTRGNAEQMQGSMPDLSSQTLRVEAKTFGRSVRLYFPFNNPTGSAVFKRNGIIWAVFDTSLDLDVETARKPLEAVADDLEVWRSGNTAVLRIPLRNSRLVTFSPEGYGWLLTIGDMVVEPTKPLHMARTKISGGRSAMRVKFDGSSSVLKLRDPGTGENLHVVTGFGPARGFVKGQRLVDFTTIISAHGIALAEHVDDLQVARDEGYVYISSRRGLTLSNTEVAPIDVSGLTETSNKARETFLDLDSLAMDSPVAFTRKRQELERKLSQFKDMAAIQSELELSRLLVANGYSIEALGHLQIIEDAAPEFARGRGFRTLYAAAELMAGRPEEAFKRLNHPEFDNDPDASVWRGLAAARTHRWREAEDALDLASTVAPDYSDSVRQMMLLDGVEISLIDQQFGSASAALAEVNPAFLNDESIARYNLLRGRIAVAMNKPQEAFEAFKASRDTGYLPISNQAWLQDIKLRQQEKVIDVDQAIDELEGLSVVWRGDDVELNALRTLAHLYVDKGEYRSAFETLHSAADSDPNSDVARVLQEEMNAVFSSLFLDGKVNELSAIKALSLYYDFRELTPVGRRGDEMVRRLADKLVEVDLLDRAADLLKHQVDNRLKGAARSQIAADLAMVYLLDSKPNLALDTLRRTRQSQLPLSLERQRRLVEAKALAELNKVNLALDILKPLQGDDVEQLRADILWRAKRWQDAAEQIEVLLGDRWTVGAELDENEQTNILRAGIAYTLADDRLGLDRLRRKFADKMSNSPVAGAFDVVSMPIESNGQQFQAIAQEIAGIDTMERFLKEYRTRYMNADAKPETATPEKPADTPDNPQV
ncbi:hypothetical protein SAMN04515647_4584 [Cohaesibacter sp. ES.047]|uniref:tetratricopeptide repeat protein n=1 Tax=Cohaesibacter sp. ES.047 TaxID=1798205 RepID=UPI000BB97688|nr:hypothetical protein [Cohaesibacter sp. ES.047]SNY94261.1 hypothetical protein SAMN04515647_4584 [Cohaesibacter sp. ES.047]